MPARPLHFRLAVPEDVVELRTTLVGLKEQVRPAGTVSVRLTVLPDGCDARLQTEFSTGNVMSGMPLAQPTYFP